MDDVLDTKESFQSTEIEILHNQQSHRVTSNVYNIIKNEIDDKVKLSKIEVEELVSSSQGKQHALSIPNIMNFRLKILRLFQEIKITLPFLIETEVQHGTCTDLGGAKEILQKAQKELRDAKAEQSLMKEQLERIEQLVQSIEKR